VAFPPGRPCTPASPMSMQTSALHSAQPRARRGVAASAAGAYLWWKRSMTPSGRSIQQARGRRPGRPRTCRRSRPRHRNCRLWSEDSPDASPCAATEPDLPSQAQLAHHPRPRVRRPDRKSAHDRLSPSGNTRSLRRYRPVDHLGDAGQQARRQARAGEERPERQRGCQLRQHRESGGAVSRFTGDPGGEIPRAREPFGRLAQSLRNRYRQWEAYHHGRLLIFHAPARRPSGAVPVRRLGVRREGGGKAPACRKRG
jgi:hypothetical protein